MMPPYTYLTCNTSFVDYISAKTRNSATINAGKTQVNCWQYKQAFYCRC